MSSPRSFWMTHHTKMSLCCETYFEYILLSFDEGVFKNHNEPLSQYKTAVLGIGKLSFFCSKLRIPRQGQCKNHRSPSTRDMFGDDDDQHSIWWRMMNTRQSVRDWDISRINTRNCVHSAVYNLRAER